MAKDEKKVLSTTLAFNPIAEMQPGKKKFIFNGEIDEQPARNNPETTVSFAWGTVGTAKVRVLVMRKDREVPATLIEGAEYEINVRLRNGYMGAILAA